MLAFSYIFLLHDLRFDQLKLQQFDVTQRLVQFRSFFEKLLLNHILLVALVIPRPVLF